MPEMRFRIRWPDGREESCYSPSLVIKDFLAPGATYALSDFLARSREALTVASDRVMARYGVPCSLALGQLKRIEATGRGAVVPGMKFPRHPSGARVMVSGIPHHAVVVVGGGQAGLSISAHLGKRGIEHVIFEKYRVAHAWRSQRWDAFCLVTPNWQCQLPGFSYAGPDPKGFMPRDAIVAYVEAFARVIEAPVREGVAVTRIARGGAGPFRVETSAGPVTADAVVLAVSAYHIPNIPALAESLPAAITQIHSAAYKNPAALPAGAVVVVGSGQSGCQIAEDLHLAGRRVHLVVGSAPRCPRVYRGRDAVEWLSDIGQYDVPVDRHPKGEAVRRQANHYLTGRDGGRDIDLRRFAAEGMQLHGRLVGIADGVLRVGNDLARNLDNADAVYNGICDLIDTHIAESGIAAPSGRHYTPVWQPPGDTLASLDLAAADVSTLIWATGFRSDWRFVDLPLCDPTGYPTHRRGVTAVDGLYVVGMPWLHTWGSGRFLNVGRDAEFVVEHLSARRTTHALRIAS